MKLSKYIFHRSFKRDEEHYQLILATRTNDIFAVDADTWSAIRNEQFELLDESTSNLLLSRGLLTNEKNELANIIQENIEITNQEEELYFAVQATASCQLGCSYCGQSHGPKRYSSDDIEKVAHFIAAQVQKNSAKKLKLGLFGAEPLLALSQNLNLVQKLKSILGNDFPIRSKMASNGLKLSYDILKTLHEEAGLDTVDVTIDGLAKIHDQRRMLKNGLGSFDAIWNNLQSLHPLVSDKLSINIRCNVDSLSIDSMEDFLIFLANHEWTKKMTLYFAPVHSWGNDADQRIMEKEMLSLQLLQLRVRAMSLGLKIDGFIPKRTFKACMALDKRSAVIDPSLNIFTCTEIPLVKSYEKEPHQSKSGNIHNYQRSDYSAFYDEVLNGDWPCARCPLFPACGGACPKSWKEGRTACPPIKTTIDATLDFLAKNLFKADEVFP
ncbi:MAG: radical SAM protein [Bacillota bacterium]